MRRLSLVLSIFMLFAIFAASAGAKGTPPVANPIASYTPVSGPYAGNYVTVSLYGSTTTQVVNGQSGVTPDVVLGSNVDIAQRGGCQEGCAVSWYDDGVLVHTGSVAVSGFGDLGFSYAFTTTGYHVLREVLTTSKQGVVVSTSDRSLVLPVS